MPTSYRVFLTRASRVALSCCALAGGCAPTAQDAAPDASASGTSAPSASPDPSSAPEPARDPGANADLCPASPAGATEIARGCSAVELARRPERLFGDALRELGAASRRLGSGAAFAPTRAAVDATADALRHASSELAGGDVCGAAASARRANEALAGTETALASVLTAARAARASHAAYGAPSDDDGPLTDPEQHAPVELLAALTRSGLAPARDAVESAQRLCAAVAGPFETRATVARVDNATGLVHLADGTVVAIAPSAAAHRVFAGREAALTGVRFADGTVLATRADSAVTVPADALPPPGVHAVVVPLPPQNCLQLRVVPIQPGYPTYAYGQVNPGGAIHTFDGYTDASGVVHLEVGSGLTVTQLSPSSSCPTSTSDGSGVYYGVDLTVDNGLGFGVVQLASDLEANEAVVFPRPYGLFDGLPQLTLTASFYRKNCRPFFGVLQCDTPVQLRTETYHLDVEPQGAYVNAVYSGTRVGVVDNGVAGDFESLRLVGYSTTAALPSGAALNRFVAEGYKVPTSGAPALGPVLPGDSFAVYETDFTSIWSDAFDPPPINYAGQDQPSALRWVRLEGTRNGAPFWYSARTPRLTRDRIATCPFVGSSTLQPPPTRPNPDGGMAIQDPPSNPFVLQSVDDSFYDLPYPNTFSFRNLNGNIDDPVQTRRHPEWQAYAFDFGANMYDHELAARSGVVAAYDESCMIENLTGETYQDGDCTGNYLWIRHMDGTYAVHYHIAYNGVIPSLNQVVRRGEYVAQTGQTGYASGPHVHWEVHSIATPGTADWNNVRSRFRARVNDMNGSTNNCYIPRSTDTVFSVNTLRNN